MIEMRLTTILVIAASAYAVWTPFYFLTKPVPEIPPTGARVEPILRTGSIDASGRIVRRAYGYRQRESDIEDPSPILYEGSTPLPADQYEFAAFNPANRWRDVTFTAIDGRRYYAVFPKPRDLR